jgi:predicted permease
MSIPQELLRELWLDLKHSVRIYARRPLTTALAIVALGLAIGASTGVFSVLNALLLRGLPFAHPDQLVEVPSKTAMSGRAGFNRWQSSRSYLQSAASFSRSEMNVSEDRDTLRAKVAEVSANWFSVLGVTPTVGRGFASGEDIFGHNELAVISYGLWQQVFAGDPGVVGRHLRVNGAPFTIIGVAPAGFDYPQKTNVWLPTVFNFEIVPKRGVLFFQTVGRLKPGVSLRTADEFVKAEVRREHGDEQSHLTSIRDQIAGPVQKASWVLAGLTLLVLLTACANVAQLLLARATERQHELDVRIALGASRARLLQQLITEASVLTVSGALLGLTVAYWVARVASAYAPAQLQAQQYTIIDWRVLLFATILALTMGIFVGLLPRLQSSSNLVRSRAASGDRSTKKLRFALLAIQAALAVCLITSSLAMGQTFLHLIRTDLGFQHANVVTLNVSLQSQKYDQNREWQYYSEALQKLRSVPGVESAGAVSHLPLATDEYMAFSFQLDSGQKSGTVLLNSITRGYLKAMGIRLLAGRDFADNETQNSEPSVIVNEAFAQNTKLGSAVIGRHLIAPWSKKPYRIVGLMETARIGGPSDMGSAQIFWPIQEEPPTALSLVAKVDGPADSYLARCRDALKTVDRNVPVYDVETMDQHLDTVLQRPRFYATATLFLASLAVLLAAVGIFGTAAQAVAQRNHEMGIRMALGASYAGLRTMVISASLLPILFGTAAGIALSLATGQSLRHLIEDVPPPGINISLAAAAILLLSGLIAAWNATSRLLEIDPIEAIRAE